MSLCFPEPKLAAQYTSGIVSWLPGTLHGVSDGHTACYVVLLTAAKTLQ